MNPGTLLMLATLSLIAAGCASSAGSPSAPPTTVTGEWLGNATVGPEFNCCFGMAGPVRLMLEQKGEVVSGTLAGVGFSGTISGSVHGKQLWGTCMCGTRMQLLNVYVEGSISDDDMVFRVSDSTMTLSRTH